MIFGVDRPWLLGLLVLALVPFVRSGRRTAYLGSVSVVPADPVSTGIKWALRTAAVSAFSMIIVALSDLSIEVSSSVGSAPVLSW